MVEFCHSEAVWAQFPQLVPAALYVEGARTDTAPVDAVVAEYTSRACSRLAGSTIADLPEIRAWRRSFAAMGLKPTQYRCASESLLRRLDKHGSLPRIHPLVDLCNALSVAFAIPVAALDVSRIVGALEVRHARGHETYESFSGEHEHPAPGEIVFVDYAEVAHARRWTNRQSGASAVRPSTRDVLIVVEGLHPTAPDDVPRLAATLATALSELWGLDAKTAVLTRELRRFVT